MVINCLIGIGLMPFVRNFTHLGGIVYSSLCSPSTMECLSTDFLGIAMTFWNLLRNVLIRFSGLILNVVLIIITTGVPVEFNAGTRLCPSCWYILCVPFPPWAGKDNNWWYCNGCLGVTAGAKLDASRYNLLLTICGGLDGNDGSEEDDVTI
jgi:hypothetical protein